MPIDAYLKKYTLSVIVIFPLVLALFVKNSELPGWLYNLFCVPAAWLASFYLNGTVSMLPDGGAAISSEAANLFVVPECAGIKFFLLLLSLSFFTMRANLLSSAKYLLLLPASYLVCIFLNSSRLILVWNAKIFLTDNFIINAAVLHLAIGVTVFFSGLLAARIILLYIANKNRGA